MAIKFAVEKALDGKYNYGPEVVREQMKLDPVGQFETPQAACEAFAAAVQVALAAGRPK